MARENDPTGNLSAEELGEQSSYEDSTEMMRRMQRGDESIGDADTRDTAGATAFRDTEEGRTDRDTTPGGEAEDSTSAKPAADHDEK